MKAIFTVILIGFFATTCLSQNNPAPGKSKAEPVYFKFPPGISNEDYLPRTIILKIKPEYRNSCRNNVIEYPALNKILSESDISVIKKKFLGKKAPERSFNERGEKWVDLSLIYELKYKSDIDIEKAINALYHTGIIEYAEPCYIPKPLYATNDPDNGLVYTLAKMNVFNGWDISKGDTNVVIGITDTGVDFAHADLVDNIKHNYNDIINGIDDDGDGYVDNFSGWDIGEGDNDPQSTISHGVHVSGIAAASTDNNIGISGVAFKCKFLPVKITNASGSLTKAYEGIVYAADQGCQIINCSWGSTSGGQLGQDIINYATINKNSLVVCGAGNNSNQEKFYPSAYNNALSVAATNNSDVKWSGSSFGYYVDVSAPGEAIYSTIGVNSYGYSSGTSMASPNVAGAAAIVKSYFPSYTALQVGEQLKVTSDNIYALNNADYVDKLGAGRINLFRALTETTSPSVVMTERTITDNNDNAFIIGDTLNISGVFTNYLAPVNNLSVTLTSASPYVNIIDGTVMLGAITTLGTVNNNPDPFKVIIKDDTPVNSMVTFKITFTDGSYSANTYFDVNIAVDYVNIAINDVATSITSKGKIGYNKENQNEGLGFTYMGHTNMLYEAGLMIGNSTEAVSDAVKDAGGTNNNDFESYINVKKIPSIVSELDVEGHFSDNNAVNPLNIFVYHNAFAWSSPGNRKYVIVLYHIKNTGNIALNNLYTGIFADWDIMNYALNKVDFDAGNKMGYAWSAETNGLYAGIKLLSSTAPVVSYAIDNIPGGGGGIDLTDNFDTSEKYISMSTNRIQAGITGTGNDIAMVVSSGPYHLSPGDTAVVSFALLAGDNLSDLQVSALAAQVKYDTEVPLIETLNELWLGQSYPNPAFNDIALEFNLPETASVKLSIYNLLGQEVMLLLEDNLPRGRHRINAKVNHLGSGIYLYKLTANDVSLTGKMTVVVK